MAERDEVDTPRLVVFGVVGTIIVMLMVLLAQIIYYRMTRAIDLERNVVPQNRALGEYLAEQNEKLHRYAWVDPKAGTVAIPIERAMSLTVEELRRRGSGGRQSPPNEAPL